MSAVDGSATRVVHRSANEDLYRLYRQSIEDIGALRLYEWFVHRLRTEYDCEPAPDWASKLRT